MALARGGFASTADPDSPWFAGPFGYLLENPKQLPRPILCRGQRGLFEVPEQVEREVRAAAKELRP
jgi:hypothetical protein